MSMLATHSQPMRPENLVFPALPTLPPGTKLCWIGEYVWDQPTHWEAWAKGLDGKLWVSKYLKNGWTKWVRNTPGAA